MRIETGEDELRELLDAFARAKVPPSARRDGQLVVDGQKLSIEIKRLSAVTPRVASGPGRPAKGTLGVVLADRISEEARRELASRGWGWVDRRGHLRVWMPGLRISTAIESRRTHAPDERLASVFPPVGIEVALALLEEPERDWSLSGLAARIGRAAGGISERGFVGRLVA